MASKSSTASAEVPWVMPLGRDIVLEGKLKFSGSMVLNGQFTGTIMSDGHLRLGPEAVVKGNISADEVHIEGEVEGNIDAKGRVLLGNRSRVAGDVTSSILVVEEGAMFSGRSDMRQRPAES